MKQFLLGVFLFSTAFLSYGSIHALSFAPDTKFLDAQTESQCKSLGGDFIQWYNEKYCTQPKSFTTFKDLIKAEPMCKVATDGCNTVQVNNGELGVMTMMYCENTYGNEATEKWSCLDDTLEQETLGFMSDSQKTEYKEIVDTLSEKRVMKVQEIVNNFGDRILQNMSYDMPKSYTLLDKAIAKIEFHLMTSKYGNQTMYNSVRFLKFELMILKNRWEQNTGVSSNK